jgi:hypothetical protein
LTPNRIAVGCSGLRVGTPMFTCGQTLSQVPASA